MTAKLPITKAQAKTLVEAAKEGDCIIEVEASGLIWRVIPAKSTENQPKQIDPPKLVVF